MRSHPGLDNFEKYIDIEGVLHKTGASNIVCVSLFGSALYGNNNAYSDLDYTIVIDGPSEEGLRGSNRMSASYKGEINLDAQVYFKRSYARYLTLCRPTVTESYFSHYKRWFVEPTDFGFKLKKRRLYESISSSVRDCMEKYSVRRNSRSYEKTVKMIFRSIQMYRFAIQLVTTGKMYDFSVANHVHYELNSKIYDFDEILRRWHPAIQELDKVLYSLCYPNGFETEKLI